MPLIASSARTGAPAFHIGHRWVTPEICGIHVEYGLDTTVSGVPLLWAGRPPLVESYNQLHGSTEQLRQWNS
jgi:hypothetical protein